MLSHDDLMNSLADHLAGGNRMVWRDLQLGTHGSPRPDVYTIDRSFAHPAPMAYECKVTREDFRGDVTSGKWQTYLRYAEGVVFACQDDLIKKSDVPPHCGLIVLRTSWRLARKPVLNPVVVPQEALLKLLIDGVQREGPATRRRLWNENLQIQKIKQKFGERVGRCLRDYAEVEHEIRGEQYRAERIVEEAERRAKDIEKDAADRINPLRNELAGILGLRPDATSWALRDAVSKLRADQKEHPQEARYRRFTALVKSAIAQCGHEEQHEKVHPVGGAEG